jgi:hypothetical protein
MTTQYILCWQLPTGELCQSRFTGTKEQLERVAEEMNRRHPTIHHWIEEVQDEVGTSRPN